MYDRVQKDPIAVGRKLDAVSKAGREILHKLRGAASIAFANQPGADQLRIGVVGKPGANIAADLALGHLPGCRFTLLGLESASVSWSLAWLASPVRG